MADDTSPKSEPEIVSPAPGPLPSREPRHDPGVIEGEATEVHSSATSERQAADAPEEALSAQEPPADVASRSPPGGARSFLAGLAGALLGAVAAVAAAWVLDPRAGEFEPAMVRLASLERQADDDKQADAGLDKRLRALEANEAGAAKSAALDALGRRVAALESAAGKNEAAQNALDEARAARADAAKALALAGRAPPAQSGEPAAADTSALDARLGKLESDLAGLKPAVTDLGAFQDRLAKVEGALAAPKNETRVPPSETAPAGGSQAAILAISLVERLNAGAPYAQELEGLSRLGADGAKLAALKPFAETGAPTLASLHEGFVALAPAVAAAATPAEEGGVADRLLDHMRKLVKVHSVGAPAANDPEGSTSRIAASLASGDLASALDAYERLPPAAQRVAADWAKSAQARQAAGAAALALRAETIDRLATAKN